MADDHYYDISTIFAEIEDYLLESMKRNMRRHIGEEKQLGINWTQWQAEMLKGLEEYKHDNERIFNYVYPEVNKKIDELIRLSYASGESEQEAEILAAIRKGYKKYHPIHDINGEFFNLNRRKLNALISETTQSMEKAEYAALRMVNDQYRKIIFGAHTFYSSGAGTLWQAVDMASKNFLSAGLNCIEYKNGKCVNIASYAEMAIRTANTRAYLHGEAAKREWYGIHTVLVNRHSAACPKCTDWQGRVFIDDVWGGGTAEESQAKGYPLLSEAIAGGLYHPNCKDSHSTYFAGISKIPKALTDAQKEEQIRRYNLQQQQRYNERNIRKYKRLYEGTQDESQREKYLKKLKAWQKRTRDLIEENPDILRRAPEREKLRDSLKHLGITPPSVPPGIEIKIKQPEPKNTPNAPRIIIEGRFVDPAKRVKVKPAGTAAAERQKDIEKIQAKLRIVTAKAKELQEKAKIAQYKAAVAETKAKIATRNANTARGQINLIKAKAQIRDKKVSQQIFDARLAAAEAKKLRSIAEIDKIEMRAAKRRYSAIMRMQNGGHLKVAVTTKTVQQIPVKVKPQPTAKKVVATAVKPVVKTREQLAAEISKQEWLKQVPKECRSDVKEMFGRMDDKRLSFFAKYGNLIKGDFNHKGRGYKQRGKIYIDFTYIDDRCAALKYDKANIRVFLHETGHLMDEHLEIQKNLPELCSKLRNDFYNYTSNLFGKPTNKLSAFTPKERSTILNNLSDKKTKHLKNGVSDLIDGLTRGEIRGPYGHTIEGDNSYWLNAGNPLVDEAIAHLFEVYMNGGEKYQIFKRYFPSAMQYFEDYINKLI